MLDGDPPFRAATRGDVDRHADDALEATLAVQDPRIDRVDVDHRAVSPCDLEVALPGLAAHERGCDLRRELARHELAG